MSFDLLKHTKQAARDAVNNLESPDDDIIPVLLTYGPRGLSILGSVMSADEDGRDAFADEITARVAVQQATEATMVCAAYVTLLDAVTGKVSPKQETVVLMHYSADETVTPQAWTAKITRHENRPPDMSVWEELGKGAMGGRFADAIMQGIEFAKTSHDPYMQKILDDGHNEGRVDELVEMFRQVRATMRGSNDPDSDSS
ncbi:MAG: hypothetical protein WCJ18_00290 [Planctomycetota bacterium]